MAAPVLRASVVSVLLLAAVTSCSATGHGHMRDVGALAGRDGWPSFCPAPGTAAGARVSVLLSDAGTMPMMRDLSARDLPMSLRVRPLVVRSGTVTLVAVNLGSRRHELVVLPLGRGQAEGRRAPGSTGRIDERGALGEASGSCTAGEGDGIRPGRAGWVTLNLVPGRYELVCNLPHHYSAGMHQVLVVRSRDA